VVYFHTGMSWSNKGPMIEFKKLFNKLPVEK
jgi:hypothetical protein